MTEKSELYVLISMFSVYLISILLMFLQTESNFLLEKQNDNRLLSFCFYPFHHFISPFYWFNGSLLSSHLRPMMNNFILLLNHYPLQIRGNSIASTTIYCFPSFSYLIITK